MSFEEYGFENFKIVKEDWNTYKLKDNSYLKTRVILNWIARGPQQSYSFNISPVLNSVLPPQNLRGSPATRPIRKEELQQTIVDEDLHWTTINEDWNAYELKNGIKIYVKAVLVKVDRTSICDNNGFSIYLIQSQVITKVNVPKELRDKKISFQTSREQPTFTV
jgi:hypothetical protein